MPGATDARGRHHAATSVIHISAYCTLTVMVQYTPIAHVKMRPNHQCQYINKIAPSRQPATWHAQQQKPVVGCCRHARPPVNAYSTYQCMQPNLALAHRPHICNACADGAEVPTRLRAVTLETVQESYCTHLLPPSLCMQAAWVAVRSATQRGRGRPRISQQPLLQAGRPSQCLEAQHPVQLLS